jgi:hypothetical protein
MRHNLPGIIVLIALWVISCLFILRLDPKATVPAAATVAFGVSLILCLPVAFFAGLVARLIQR